MRARLIPKLAAAAMTAVALLATPLGPAFADGTGMPIGLGSTATSTGLPAGVVGFGTGMSAANALADSNYSLSSIDPLSSAMSMGAIGTAMTSDYAITSDLADSDLSSIDAAQMAQTARMQEDAERAAQAAAAAKNKDTAQLKAGAVPAKYEDDILSAVANQCPQLTAPVLAAQLEAESGWNPKAQSGAGAMGIAQFTAGTWKTYGIDADGDGTADVWDPADAIAAAAHYDCVIRDIVRKVPGDLDSNMLAGYNAGPGAVLKYDGVPPYTQTQDYVTKILTRAAEMTDYTVGSPGDDGTSAGCPVTAPAGTLRENARQYTIGQICADSVAQARSPEAARAIKFALRNLGAPYSQPDRMGTHSFDCSSFVSRAYASAGLSQFVPNGWALTTATLPTAAFTHVISFSSRRPGDLVLPFPGHVTMSLADGLKVHTNHTGDVSNVTDNYTSAYMTLAVDPAKAH